jgi:hypothetical protein
MGITDNNNKIKGIYFSTHAEVRAKERLGSVEKAIEIFKLSKQVTAEYFSKKIIRYYKYQNILFPTDDYGTRQIIKTVIVQK